MAIASDPRKRNKTGKAVICIGSTSVGFEVCHTQLFIHQADGDFFEFPTSNEFHFMRFQKHNEVIIAMQSDIVAPPTVLWLQEYIRGANWGSNERKIRMSLLNDLKKQTSCLYKYFSPLAVLLKVFPELQGKASMQSTDQLFWQGRGRELKIKTVIQRDIAERC